MGKKLFIATVCVLGLFGAFTVKHSLSVRTQLSSLTIQNIEALTDTELPEFTVICSPGPDGKCYRAVSKMIKWGPYMADYDCEFSGKPNDECHKPWFLLYYFGD